MHGQGSIKTSKPSAPQNQSGRRSFRPSLEWYQDLSIRSRMRLSIAIVMVLVLGAMLWCLMRMNQAELSIGEYVRHRDVVELSDNVQLTVKTLQSGFTIYQSDPVSDHFEDIRRSLDILSRTILKLEKQLDLANHGLVSKSLTERENIENEFSQLLELMKNGIERVHRNVNTPTDPKRGASADKSIRRARLALDSVAHVAEKIHVKAEAMSSASWQEAENALLSGARDQLVICLALLMLLPLMIWSVPIWFLAPFERLVSFSERVKEGRMKHDKIYGTDEVARLFRTIQTVLSGFEEGGHRKTRKIIEVNKTLRAVVSNVDIPLMVIGRGNSVDILSPSMAELFGDETHHLEGQAVDEICFAPQLVDRIEQIRLGEDLEEADAISLETQDGRVEKVIPRIIGIQDHQAKIAKIVLTMEKVEDEEPSKSEP